MTKIILLRHGETEWNKLGKYQGQSDVALSEKGRQQAQALAQHFPVKSVQAVYSSDLQRARETAAIASAAFSCTVQTDSRLREFNFGDWEGLTYAQITERWPSAMKNFFQHPDILEVPHGETFQQLQQRAMEAVQEIVSNHEGETVVLAAHGAVNRTILAAVLHIPLQYIWSMRQDNTAVNILRHTEGHYILELMNSTAHLRSSLESETFFGNSVDKG